MAELQEVYIDVHYCFQNPQVLEAIDRLDEITADLEEDLPWKQELIHELKKIIDVLDDSLYFVADEKDEEKLQKIKDLQCITEDGYDEEDDDDHPFSEYYTHN